MKYKLKELTFDNLKLNNFTTHTTNFGKIYNLNECIEFQTPKVKIISITDDYLTLQILPSEACRIFFTKIHEFETTLKNIFENLPVLSIFENDTFKIKIKNKTFKIYLNGNLFNIYHLKTGMDIICLVSISRLWVNDKVKFNLKVNEMLIKS